MAEECNDKNCPVHGSIKVRGNYLQGIVVSDKMKDTVVVERRFLKKIPKFERYTRSKARLAAHKPACMNVKIGDKVEIGETRRMSKTKSFVVTKVMTE